MKQRGLHGRKLNNQGFSLVEILVALSILMIITIPLLHGFVLSARVNAKSKNVLRATTAGGNVMERLKSTSIADYEDMTYEETLPDGTVMTHKVCEYDSTSNLYTMTFPDEQVDGKGYRVVATLDPNYYKNTALDTKLQYNNDINSFTEIYDMNSDTNAFLIEDSSMETDALSNLGLGPDKMSQVSRRIAIRIKEDSGNVEVYGTIQYTYGDKKWYSVNNQCIYMERSGASKLQNVYLLFDPAFLGSERMEETVEVDNSNNYPLNVYLVKQDTTSSASANEQHYKLTLLVKEGTRTDLGDVVITNIRTNVDDAKLTVKYYDGASYRENVTVKAVAVPARQLVGGIKDLVSGEARDRIYKVNIKVYEQESSEPIESREPIYEMEGTKEE